MYCIISRIIRKFRTDFRWQIHMLAFSPALWNFLSIKNETKYALKKFGIKIRKHFKFIISESVNKIGIFLLNNCIFYILYLNLFTFTKRNMM